MSRPFRIVVSLSCAAALLVLVALLVPVATGSERHTERADRYFFGQNVEITEPVAGNVQVYGGDVTVSSEIEGDLLVFGGDVLFNPGGRLGGDLISGGGRVMGEEGHVAGRSYSLASLQGATLSLQKTAVVLLTLCVWLVAALILTLVSGREVRYSSVEIRASAGHCFLVGLVAITSFILSAIVFSYLVPFLVGIPLLAALGVFALLTKIYGMIAVFHAAGSLIASARTRDQLASRRLLRGDLAMVMVGLLVLGAIRLIPVVGPAVWSLASVFGVGVALATKFGRREPWFLAWRPIYEG